MRRTPTVDLGGRQSLVRLEVPIVDPTGRQSLIRKVYLATSQHLRTLKWRGWLARGLKQLDEAFLSKVSISGQSFADGAVAHDKEAWWDLVVDICGRNGVWCKR
jgi:hypothetical protein